MTAAATAIAPATMRAIAFTAKERAELVDWPLDPAPLGPDEVAGRTLVTLASPGTELNGYIAERTKPGLSGYASVFVIDAVGSAVRDRKVGDIVFFPGAHLARQRGRAEATVPVPAGLDPAVAVFCRLMGVSWSTLITTTARPPDRVLVTGLGPVGNLAAQVFAAAGYRVTAIDPVAARRELAQGHGLADVRAAVPLDEAGFAGSVQIAVECSGHEAAVLDCCKVVRKRGEVAMIGVPWRRRSDLHAFDLLHAVFHRYIVLRSGWEWEVPHQPRDFAVGSIAANYAGALDWLKDGKVRVAGLGQRVAPADCQAVWQDLLHQRGPCPTAVFDWSV
jgi:NADPH:quinone reductase-like Zn-dependent oxidoreductase